MLRTQHATLTDDVVGMLGTQHGPLGCVLSILRTDRTEP